MKKLLILSFLFALVISVNAQNDDTLIQLKGKVIDSSNDEGIAFASIWIENSYVGVASDFDGGFSINISDEYMDSNLVISVVGYSSYTCKVSDCKQDIPLIIKLRPKSFLIGDVNISGKSMVLQALIKKAINNISKNYIQTPFSYDAYYKCDISANDTIESSREVVMKVYDKKGYTRESVVSTFRNLNYLYSESRKSKENTSLSDGFTVIDDLLTCDIVRNTRNILDERNINNYELSRVGDLFFEGDSVVVISYKSRHNSISNIGQSGVNSYSGRIYINKSNFAIVKNELKIVSKEFSFLGKNLITPKSQVEKATYRISTSYGRIKDHYYFRGASLNVVVDYSDKESKVYDTQLIPVKIKIGSPDVMKGREYYENESFRKEFWNRFSLVFEGEE